jgi:hypothetical protein
VSKRELTEHEWRRLELAMRFYGPDDNPHMNRIAAFACADEWIAAARLDEPAPEQAPDLVVEGSVVKEPVVRDFMALREGPPGLPDTCTLPMYHGLPDGARYRVTFTKMEEGK